MAALASDRLRHFRLLLWNRWTEFKETCQEASSQRPLQSLCFGPIGKTTWRPWPLIGWDIFYFSSETAERNSMKLDRKQDLNVLYQVCVFRADRKNKMAVLASDFLRIFDFSSETAERNSMKLDRKQDFKVLYQVCVFRADRKNKMAALASDRLRHFRLLLWNRWTEFKETCQEASSQRPLQSLCFGPIGKTTWRPWPLIGWDIFYFSSETAERNSMKLDRKQDLNVLYQVCVFRADRKNKMAVLASDFLRIFDFSSETAERNSMKLDRKQDFKVLYQVCVFRADRKNKMAALASDRLRHFRLLLWNRWTEFKETCQEASSQRPLQSLCFGPIGKTTWRPWPLIGWDIFYFSSETAERNSMKLDRKQDLNVLYQVCVFRADRKKKWPSWPLIFWDIFDFSSETAERNSMKLDSKQDFKVLYQVCVFRADRKNKMAALASDRLRHFRLLLWNHWTEFNETCQEARSQRPLPSLCSLGRSENKIGRPGCFFKRLHIVLRCTICGPLGLLFNCLGYAFTCHIWKVWAAVLT